MLYLLFWIVLLFPGILVALISFLVPRELMKLYVSWYAILALIAYAWIIQIPFQPGDRFSGLDIEIFKLNFSISVLIIFIRVISITESNKSGIVQELLADDFSDTLRGINYFTLAIFSFLSIYYLYLFEGDLLAGFQPAYLAYIIVLICLFLLFYILISANLKESLAVLQPFLQYLQFFSYLCCGIIVALLIFSLSIPSLVIKETKKVIGNNNLDVEYCIQMLTARNDERYQNITSLLDLSPLTMQSKANLGKIYGWGNPYFHALLIVNQLEKTDLYNWSYKPRKWSYLAPGFAERASIDRPEIVCTPRKSYLKLIPVIFPQANS